MSITCREDIDSFDPESGPLLPSQITTRRYMGPDFEDILHELALEDLLKEAMLCKPAERKKFLKRGKRKLRKKKR